MEMLVVITVIAALATLVIGMVDRSRDDAELTIARSSMKAIAEGITGSSAGTGYLEDLKHVPGFQASEIRIHDLFSPSSYPAYAGFDPAARRGWRGPYLKPGVGAANLESSRSGRFPAAGDRRFSNDPSYLDRGFFTDSYGNPGDLSLGDPWGNPYLIQTPPSSAFAESSSDGKRFRYTRVVSAGPDGVLTCPADRLAGMLPDGTASLRGDDLVLFLNRADVYEEEEL